MCCIFLPSTLIFLVHFDTTSFSTEGVAGLYISGHVVVRGMFRSIIFSPGLNLAFAVVFITTFIYVGVFMSVLCVI